MTSPQKRSNSSEEVSLSEGSKRRPFLNHNVTRCGSLVLRTSKGGTFSGLVDELKKNDYATFSEAVVARARRLSDKRDDKRKRTETEADPQSFPEAAEDGDVEFVEERTRQERDREGMANAVSVE